MAKQNAINNKSSTLTIDPGASGDSYVQFDINTTGKFRIGVDDDDSDKFKISLGSALGTNDAFVMTGSGENTMPLQPAFMAYVSSTISNVTGDGTTYTVTFNTEVFDQNSDFSSTTFIAPITGKYMFVFNYQVADVAAAHTNHLVLIDTSNRYYKGDNINIYAHSTSGDFGGGMTAIADMDASDTTIFTIRTLNGTKVVDVVGSANAETCAGGFLIC